MTSKNKNLVVRIATVIVILPFVLWLIWRGGLAFALLISAAAAACALELNMLPQSLPEAESELEEIEQEGALATGATIVSIAGAFLIPLLEEISLGVVTAGLVLTVVVIVAFTDALLFEERIADAPRRVGLAVLGAAYPGLLIAALIPLRQLPAGQWWIMLALTVTWLNDTAAYFTGRAFGRRKLYERISPSKTWEGAIGGAAGSIVGALIVQRVWLSDQLPAWGAAVIGAGAAFLGPLGDLSESMLKRAYGAKDSSHLLPGHGGILDRIDALLFNAPFVLLCARLLT
jgi:phosphatidate cytidylyltransferase